MASFLQTLVCLLPSVVSIQLSYNFLSGSLPSCRWANLTVFDATANSLSGTIPESIDNWSRIEYVHLYSNRFTGTLPESIGQWTSLEELDVSFNSLHGTLLESISNWSRTMAADFFNNDFTGTLSVVSMIGTWTNLEVMQQRSWRTTPPLHLPPLLMCYYCYHPAN